MIRKIYFMGIKGVGMASLAIIAKQAGFVVSGSDVETEFITDKTLKDAGIEVYKGFSSSNVSDFFGTTPVAESLMVITGAHNGFDNAEASFATGLGIKVISHGEAVGLFMSGKLFARTDLEGISISGAHGKTTISAMIATFLTKLNLDPSYSVGTSEIIPIGSAGHYGKGKYFVAEADEYRAAKSDLTPKFLYQYPKFLIINNIDFDHPDFYNSLDDVTEAFRKFSENLTSGGLLIINGDDENLKSLNLSEKFRVITYGTGSENEFVISNFEQTGFNSHFSVSRQGTLLGRFTLSVPGYHNAKNVLAAIALLMELGVSPADIERVLPEFKGSKRRMELLGTTKNGVDIIDDYAHHPEEIRKTLEAIRMIDPTKKITVIFQAHTFGRTKALEKEFIGSFANISELIIMPTFASMRSEVDENLAEDRDFVEKIRAIQPNVKLIEKQSDVVKYISSNLHSDQIVITMGAGNVYKVGEELVKI